MYCRGYKCYKAFYHWSTRKNVVSCVQENIGRWNCMRVWEMPRCAQLCPKLILEMRGIARIAGTAGGVNRTHKRMLAGAKLRHIEGLHCRKNLLFSLKKPYITLHLLWRSLCILNIDFLTHFYIKNLCFLRHIMVVLLWKIAPRGLLGRSSSGMPSY